MKDYISLGTAWGGTVLSAITSHISFTISVLAGVAALLASVYSILINRRKLKRMIAHEQAICRECGKHPDESKCPFPEEDRPDTCPLKI